MINSDFLNSSTGLFNAKVEFFDNSTLVQTCTCEDFLQNFDIDRAGDKSKFFGYGVCQKLSVKLIDFGNVISVTSGNTVEISYVLDGKILKPYPTFTITEVNRDEDTSDLSITAYDYINKTEGTEISDVNISDNSTVRGYLNSITDFLGLSYAIIGVGSTETCFDTALPTGANVGGTEKIREILDDIAEVTQTIYYINYENTLVFKRLSMNGDPVLTISRDMYSALKTSENRRLSSICHATSLGNNLEKSLEVSGTTQYIRDNCFWTAISNEEDDSTLAPLIDKAVEAVGGFTIGQIRECSWGGNILLEIGDKLAFEKKDGTEIVSYLLDDVVSYNGFTASSIEWVYEESDGETASNPTSLGEALNQTYAKVDKVNQQIEIVSSKADDNETQLSIITVRTESIENKVSAIDNINEKLEDHDDQFSRVETTMATKLSKDEFSITLTEELTNGVDKVNIKEKNFSFGSDGLNISDSNSEINTRIDNTGMRVFNNSSEVLVADNQGVIAEDLHAITWLKIGNNSRIKDWTDGIRNKNRTGCFWLGN